MRKRTPFIIAISLITVIAFAHYPRQAHPRAADYNVTGNPDPDCTGNYFKAGTYASIPCYRRIDGSFFIWSKDEFNWFISIVLGDEDHGCWTRQFAVVGKYYWQPPCDGFPVVSVGPH